LCCFGYYTFYQIFIAPSIIIPYGLHPFDICIEIPELWYYIKISFIITYIFSSFIIANFIYRIIFLTIIPKLITLFKIPQFSKKFKNIFARNTSSRKKYSFIPDNNIKLNSSELKLYIGLDEKNNKVYLPEKSLFQNILITGTIGTGKTSSAMYPFTEQLIKYYDKINSSKIPMLILDVKGNYYLKVQEFCIQHNRMDDLIVLELGGFFKYNPLHKPHLKATVLANRLKTILLLFSPNTSESYWLDKAEQVLTECIKLCRLYNNGYVTFEEIHKLINEENYYKEKIITLRKKFLDNGFSIDDTYNLLSSLNFFEKEFFQLDQRTISILKSEITRITNCFISDYDVYSTFCPKYNELNFFGFEDILKTGKIVVLNMNLAEYKNLSKIIAAYLKLDFQTEVMNRIANNNNQYISPVAFISDEYSEYCTVSDSNFFSQSREAKCINIVATQSYTSLLNSLDNKYAVQVIIQNLINKLWFRTDDIFTIEDAQKQIGKEDKEKISKSISENAKETNYSYFSNSLNSSNSSISESINSYIQSDFIYDTRFFTQELENFSCLAFLSNGNQILKPSKLKLTPCFRKKAD